MKTYQALPESLRYLQPFVNALAKAAPGGLNEDIDPALLEGELRNRLQGLNEVAAEAALANDRELLETWLKASAPADHPAYWVLGYLSSQDLAAHMIRPATPPPRGPVMTFDTPAGWKVKVVPFRLDLKKGKLVGSIGAIDGFSFETLQRQQEYWPPGLPLTRKTLDVRFGDCAGKKYLSKQPFKSVDYLLAVPGGFVTAFLSARGADFDESQFEAKLHTLRLIFQEHL